MQWQRDDNGSFVQLHFMRSHYRSHSLNCFSSFDSQVEFAIKQLTKKQKKYTYIKRKITSNFEDYIGKLQSNK